jgi:hypothetical protein
MVSCCRCTARYLAKPSRDERMEWSSGSIVEQRCCHLGIGEGLVHIQGPVLDYSRQPYPWDGPYDDPVVYP